MNKLYFLVFIITSFISCGDDDSPVIDSNDDSQQIILPEVQTNDATNITENSARLGGNVLNEGTAFLEDRGVVWSLNTNPTTQDNIVFADGSGLGNYFVNVDNEFLPNTTYNFRAVIITNQEIVYGENKSFTTSDDNQPPPLPLVELLSIKKITTSKMMLTAVVNGTINPADGKGFVLAKFPSPTINDLDFEDGDVGTGQYVVEVEGLDSNTLYYIRPYAYQQNQIMYGEETTMRTAGYTGEAGGFVVYDKGEITDGWRYMEASSVPMTENEWGCFGTFIPGTASVLGSGQQNTNTILSNCPENNIAAKKCDVFQLGGKTDWFLGSVEEMSIVIVSMDENNTLLNYNSIWTSTQFDSQNVYWVSPSNNQGEAYVDIEYKGFSFLVLPIRTY